MESSTFRIYQHAFQTATGLPLLLVRPDLEDGCVSDQAANHSPFCEALHRCKNACHACIETNRRLLQEASVEGPATCHCFAGLTASAVPVKLGTSVVGYLKTGQVFSRTPDEDQFAHVLQSIGRKTLSAAAKNLLHTTYFQTRTLEPERYESMVALLQSFAEQLSRHAESLAVIEAGREPTAIAKARCYIHSHLGDSLTLGELAHVAGLSDSHFCRLFKEITSLTLTDYVNRCRIEWAKRELLKQEKRVSEIAFEVGYQSLSQFNRSFLRIVGSSPTNWRTSEIANFVG